MNTRADLESLAEAAWKARAQAFIFGKTKVGAAIRTDKGEIFVGCNVEQVFRSHDIHAEVNAVGTMVANGGRKILALVVVAERERFTPCGACMDWIMQFSDSSTIVAFQSAPGGLIAEYPVGSLMPHYPR